MKVRDCQLHGRTYLRVSVLFLHHLEARVTECLDFAGGGGREGGDMQTDVVRFLVVQTRARARTRRTHARTHVPS